MTPRAYVRHSIDHRVRVRAPATPVWATIIDVSRHGCRGQTDSSLISLGASVIFEFTPRDQVPGMVIWRKGGAFGVRFQRPLREVLFEELTIAAQDTSPLSNFEGLPSLDAISQPQ